jgi:hypothetical protein
MLTAGFSESRSPKIPLYVDLGIFGAKFSEYPEIFEY